MQWLFWWIYCRWFLRWCRVGVIEFAGILIAVLQRGRGVLEVNYLSFELMWVESVFPLMITLLRCIFTQQVFRLEPVRWSILARHVRGVFLVRFHVLLFLRAVFLDGICDSLVDWRCLADVKANLIIISSLVHLRLIQIHFWVDIVVLLVQIAGVTRGTDNLTILRGYLC